MEFNKNRVNLPNGEEYYYLEEGRGKNVLILVHGNMSSSVHFMPLIKSLPEDIRVIAPDLRGFGDSSYNNKFSTLRELAEDLKLFMDELGIKKAHLAGWSTGGGIVLEFASMYQDMTESLILIEAASHKGYPIFKKDGNFAPIAGKPYKSMEELATDPVQVAPVLQAINIKNKEFMKWVWDKTIYVLNKPTPEDNDVYLDETLKQRNLVEIDWALANINMSNTRSPYAEGTDTIKNVKAKTLIIWSKDDIVVPYYLVEENYQALKDNAKLVIYEKGGHSPIIDNLEELTKDILDFIN